MWWLTFQGLIIFGVVASNIHWQWTPNAYIPGLLGAGLAFGLTAAITQIRDWTRYRREIPPDMRAAIRAEADRLYWKRSDLLTDRMLREMKPPSGGRAANDS